MRTKIVASKRFIIQNGNHAGGGEDDDDDLFLLLLNNRTNLGSCAFGCLGLQS